MGTEGLVYHHRILFHNVVMGVEEEMEQERLEGYLVPGAEAIEVIDWHEERRIFTMPMQCAIVTVVKYKVTKSKNIETSPTPAMEDNATKAIEFAVRYGGTDEMHHLRWVVDQMVRVLAGDKYDEIVTVAKAGDDGPDTYEWHVGIAP